MSNLPIWSRPAPGSRKPRFSREQIAAAALAIADKEGFTELSMRRVADQLGAGTMTLYYYVRTKEDLLTLMDDALMAEVVERCTPLPEYWRAALETIADAMRTVFIKHPWALQIEGIRMGPHGLKHVEQSLAAVKSLSLPLGTKLEMLSVIDDFVFGSVLRDRETPAAEDNLVEAINELTKDYLSSGEYPLLEEIVGAREPIDAFVEFVGYMTDPGRFTRGLQVILDGFAAKYRLAERPARVTRPRKPSRRRTR